MLVDGSLSRMSFAGKIVGMKSEVLNALLTARALFDVTWSFASWLLYSVGPDRSQIAVHGV